MGDKWMAVTCPSCEERVEAEVLAERVYWPTMTPVESAWPLIARFRLVWCEGEDVCETLMLVKENLVQMPRGEQPAEADWGQAAVLYWYQGDDGEGYPALEQSPLHPLGSASQVPEEVYNVLREAEKCLKAEAFDACAEQCRKALGLVCHDHGCTGRNLGHEISALCEYGGIGGPFFEWAKLIQECGNFGAHRADSGITPEDAKDLMDFTVEMVRYIYVLNKKFERFKSRWEKDRDSHPDGV